MTSHGYWPLADASPVLSAETSDLPIQRQGAEEMLNYSKAGANKTLIRDYTDQVFNEHGGRRRPRARVVRSTDRDTVAVSAAGP